MKLIDVLDIDRIKIPLTASNKTEAIQELLSLFTDQKLVKDYRAVLEAVLEREKIMSTGVGNGVAIPHCKSPFSPAFAIALGIQPSGVDFQSLDNKPAYIIFLLIGPEDKPGTHIRLLSRISRIVSKEEVRDHLLKCSSPEEVYQYLEAQESNFFEINS